MRKSFTGYYSPTKEEYERLWEKALIVLDTNVLLNLYRLPSVARDEFFGVLELLKDRFWIPHQVALEFQRKRLTVISAERKSTDEALTYASSLVDEVKKKLDSLQIDKRGLEIDSETLIAELDKANGQLVAAIKAAHDKQLDISSNDPIREKLDTLFDSMVGRGPSSQDELDKLVENGEERFKQKIPPGFMDAEKDKNPIESSFIFDGIKYQRKYGDLILWRQLINHVKENSIKEILLITADRKEDWWWREQGRTIGPHPELIREITAKGGIELFWMYTSDKFIEHANEFLQAKVSTESVAEIKQISQSDIKWASVLTEGVHLPLEEAQYYTSRYGRYTAERLDPLDPQYIEDCVEGWLSTNIGPTERNHRGSPDILVLAPHGIHGYEVKYLRQLERMLSAPSIIQSMLRGYLEKNEGRLSAFTLVLVVSEEEIYDLSNSEIRDRVGSLLRKYPIDSIIVGVIDNGKFEFLIEQKEPTLGKGRISKINF